MPPALPGIARDRDSSSSAAGGQRWEVPAGGSPSGANPTSR